MLKRTMPSKRRDTAFGERDELPSCLGGLRVSKSEHALWEGGGGGGSISCVGGLCLTKSRRPRWEGLTIASLRQTMRCKS